MPFVEPRPSRPLAIRITPLIDVVFILLVFFMLTTRLLPVNLLEVSTGARSEPRSTHADPIPDLRILPEQRLEWDGATYALNEVTRELAIAGIDRVNTTSAPDATVHDFTLVLSTLAASGIEPNWTRESRGATRP